MTNAEATEILDHNWTKLVNPDYSDEELGEAQNLAIKALSEPTIPLSVIEDIKAEIECRMNEIKEVDEKNKTISMKGYVLGLDRAFGIIDRKVNEVTHDCTACKHSDEVDGSNCYECVKGMADNFEVNEVKDEK